MIQSAAQHMNYSGTVVYQHADDVHASHVVHSFDPVAGEQERILTLDGQPREFLRHGDEVQCFYPETRRLVVEHRAAAAFPALSEPVPGEISAHYDVRHVGAQRVAGNRCEVLELVPRDRLRYGYRLWVEPGSGLLLRAQTLGEQGIVMEQVSFTDLHIGVPVDPAQMRPSWATGGWQVEEQPQQATHLQRLGWSVTAPSGFHRLAEVIRHFVGVAHGGEGAHASSPAAAAAAAPAGIAAPGATSAAAPADSPAQRTTLHVVYSDGLATVSVFIEPGATGGKGDETQRRGSVTAFSHYTGDARVTVVGEVPPATAQSIAESVVYSRPPAP
jgi:sigma-E factor negative regulatory protein RseB